MESAAKFDALKFYLAGSFDVTSKCETIGGEEYQYLEAGHDRTQPIILLHGLGLSKNQWRGVIHLTCSSHKIYALEVPGLSQKLRLQNGQYSIPNLSRWLNKFIEQNEISDYHLVGFSAGSCIAAYHATSNPSQMRSLTLLGFPDLEHPSQDKTVNSFDPCRVSSVNTIDDITALWNQQFYDAPKLPKIMSRMYLNAFTSQKSFYVKVFQELSESAPILMARIHTIKAPTLLIRGSQDNFSSSDTMNLLKRMIPRVKFREIPNAGHLAYLEKQVAVTEHISRFIHSLSPNSGNIKITA